MSIHIGQEVFRILDEKRISTVEFARRMGMHKRSVYDIFKRHYLYTETLLKVSRAVETNLFLHYIKPEDLPSNPELQSKIDDLTEQVFSLQKELDYLKEINQLLREKR